MIRCEVLPITLSGGAGTVETTRPIDGEVISVRNPGTALGSTALYTLTRQSDGGTVFVGTAAGPWQFQPTQTMHIGTALAGTASMPGVPCASHLQLVVSGGAASGSGTLHIYYRA